MKDILVTVAIPFYNASKFLKKAISSVLNQYFQDFELILIDDGSTDDSLKIAKSFNDYRIRIISDGKNKGLIYRLNQSIELAKGKYYARMDADDIMHPMRLKIQLNYLSQNPSIDVLGTSYYSIDNNDNIRGCILLNNKCNKNNINILHPSVIALTSWFKNNPYSSQYIRIEDTELWMRTISFSTIYNLSEPLMFYRDFGMPIWKKYVRTQITAIKLYSETEKYDLSFCFSAKKIATSFLKIIICTLLYILGKTDIIVSLRKRNLIDYDSQTAFKNLTEAIK